jgi:peroxiredoxin
MKKLFLLAITTLLLGTFNGLCAAETNASNTNSLPDKQPPPPGSAAAEVNDLVARINAKINDKKNTLADLAEDLKKFDVIYAKHKDKGENPGEILHVLQMKAQLLMDFMDQPHPAEALPVFKEIQAKFPDVQINGDTAGFIAALEHEVNGQKIRDALAPGAAFPDFSETDVEGKPLSISQYKGKVVLIDFWATWCIPCVIKLPEIQKAYDKFHSKGLEVVGVSLDEEKEKLQQFTKQKKLPWPEFFDGKKWENKLAVKYGVNQTPTTYLLDRDGKIIARLNGDEDLDAEISKALKK